MNEIRESYELKRKIQVDEGGGEYDIRKTC